MTSIAQKEDIELTRITKLRERLDQISLEVIAIFRGNKASRSTLKLTKLLAEEINICNLLAILEPNFINQLKNKQL